jgi:hypothetical protein
LTISSIKGTYIANGSAKSSEFRFGFSEKAALSFGSISAGVSMHNMMQLPGFQRVKKVISYHMYSGLPFFVFFSLSSFLDWLAFSGDLLTSLIKARNQRHERVR